MLIGQDAHTGSFVHGFAARVHLELTVDFLDVRRHGVRRNRQNVADVGKRDPLGQERENFGFALRERRNLRAPNF